VAKPEVSGEQRRAPELILSELQKLDALLRTGRSVAQACSERRISSATYYRWKRQYDRPNRDEIRRWKQLEREFHELHERVEAYRARCDELRQFLVRLIVNPLRRLAIVRRLREEYGLSERRACQVLGIPRSTLRQTDRSGRRS